MQPDNSPWRDDFVRTLSRLIGTNFQDAVVNVLLRSLSSFQTVPAKPQGDGGVDGLSHNQTRAYCCYGLEYVATDTSKKRRDKICKKFRSDLRKLLEIEETTAPPARSGRGRSLRKPPPYQHHDNLGLASIMAEGTRIADIYLIVNTHEDHTVLKPLYSSFKEYLKCSNCTFVEKDCNLSVWGPKELSARAIVDEYILFQLENPGFTNLVEELDAQAQGHTIEDEEDFNKKFDYMAQRLGRPQLVSELREDYRRAWSKSLLMDHQLVNRYPALYKKLDRVRARAIRDARRRSLAHVEPAELLNEAIAEITRQIASEFDGQLPEHVCHDLGTGEVARLIGTCPLNWRPE